MRCTWDYIRVVITEKLYTINSIFDLSVSWGIIHFFQLLHYCMSCILTFIYSFHQLLVYICIKTFHTYRYNQVIPFHFCTVRARLYSVFTMCALLPVNQHLHLTLSSYKTNYKKCCTLQLWIKIRRTMRSWRKYPVTCRRCRARRVPWRLAEGVHRLLTWRKRLARACLLWNRHCFQTVYIENRSNKKKALDSYK